MLHGLDLTQFPIFTDQGNFLAAAAAFTLGEHDEKHQYRKSIDLSIHICVEHYCRSCHHPFLKELRDCKDVLCGAILKLSRARDSNHFFNILYDSISMMLDTVCDDELRKAVFKCGIFILRVHPCHWTHFANLPDFDDNNFHSSRTTFILMMENYQLLIDEMNEHINQIKEKKLDPSSIEAQQIIYQIYYQSLKKTLDCSRNSIDTSYKYLLSPCHDSCVFNYTTNMCESLASTCLSNGA